MSIEPKKVAHYYAWPSGVNGSAGSTSAAASVFSAYDIVVLGQGIEDPSHGDHANAIAIIADPQMSNTEVYGYIDATAVLADNQTKIDNWASMGVKGIFCDKFGYDWGVSRDSQNALLWCIHNKCPSGLKAYVNAWNPDDVFSSAVDATNNPLGKNPRIKAGDSYLLESYQIVAGAYQSQGDWRGRSDKISGYKAGAFGGVNMVGLTTYSDTAFNQDKMDYAYLSSVLDQLDGFGWGEYQFSASGSSADQLPFRTRPGFHGTYHTGPVTVNGNVVERQQNVGVHIDTSNNTASLLLN